jgi:hypothetical protein
MIEINLVFCGKYKEALSLFPAIGLPLRYENFMNFGNFSMPV